jgi:hypothetical protein
MLEFGPMQEANPTMRFMRLSSVRTEQIELARYGKLGASPGPVFWLRISVGPRLLHRQRITANALSAGDVGILRPTSRQFWASFAHRTSSWRREFESLRASPPNPPLSLLRVGQRPVVALQGSDLTDELEARRFLDACRAGGLEVGSVRSGCRDLVPGHPLLFISTDTSPRTYPSSHQFPLRI